MTENEISKVVVAAAIEVHRTLGGPSLHSFEHVFCRAPTRASGWNHFRQMLHGFALAIHHAAAIASRQASPQLPTGSVFVSNGGSVLASAQAQPQDHVQAVGSVDQDALTWHPETPA